MHLPFFSECLLGLRWPRLPAFRSYSLSNTISNAGDDLGVLVLLPAAKLRKGIKQNAKKIRVVFMEIFTVYAKFSKGIFRKSCEKSFNTLLILKLLRRSADRLNILADRFELLVRISLENIRSKPCPIVGVGIAGHLSVGTSRAGLNIH
jgi:hypothetical protein